MSAVAETRALSLHSSTMGHDIQIAAKQAQRAALLEEAACILNVAAREGRALTQDEDAVVFEKAKQAQDLEHDIDQLLKDKKLHHSHEA